MDFNLYFGSDMCGHRLKRFILLNLWDVMGAFQDSKFG